MDSSPPTQPIPLEALGWDATYQAALEAAGQPGLLPARVAVEFGGCYELISSQGTFNAEAGGRLRHRAQHRSELPVVGDWVLVRRDEARPEAGARVEWRLPRKTSFVRKAAGLRPEAQVVAANVDFMFVVTSPNQDWNPRRVERYLAAVAEGGAQPVLVINKVDLCENVEALVATLGVMADQISVLRISARARQGEAELRKFVRPGMTIALVGTSGVGKSTIANWLIGSEQLSTGAVRDQDDKGRHTTTHRQLVLLPGGGMLIDTPGMREFGLWLSEPDLDQSFADLAAIAKECRFGDCQHNGQTGCALQLAVAEGRVEPARFEHYRKLGSELASAQQNSGQRRAGRSNSPPAPSARHPRAKARR